MGSEGPASALLELPVHLEKPVILQPPDHPESSTIFLSNIDQVLVYYVETVYFYPANPHKSSSDVVQILKDALIQLLGPYYFMAGRLQLNLEQGRLELACNGAGVLYAGASTDLAMADLGDVAVPNPLFRNLILVPEAKALSDIPLMTFQVTRFKCGGFCLGSYMSHGVLDGIAALELFQNFCSIARGEGIKITPNPDRTMLRARDPPQVTYDHKEYIKLSDLNVSASFTTSDVANTEFEVTAAPTKHAFKTFSFSKEDLEVLKQRATEDGTVSKCSTFEAIVAHLWQARTKAVFHDPDVPSKLFFAVDMRKKINPPLPLGFAANGVICASVVSIPAGEISQKPYSYCVQKVQEAIATVSDEYIRSSIDHGQVYRGIPNIPGGIFVSAWWRIPFQELDFGWGRPIYAGPVVNDRVEFVLLLSNGTEDGLNAYLALEPSQMSEFEELVRI